MNSFGDYINNKRKRLGILKIKIATHLNIETSILDRIHKKERKASNSMLSIFSSQLNFSLTKVKFQYLKDSVLTDFFGIITFKRQFQ